MCTFAKHKEATEEMMNWTIVCLVWLVGVVSAVKSSTTGTILTAEFYCELPCEVSFIISDHDVV